MRQFVHQSLHDVPGQPYQINVVQTVQAPMPKPSEQWGLILDIDVGTTDALSCDDGALQDHLTRMHWLKNKAFFSLVTKKAIESFGGTTS